MAIHVARGALPKGHEALPKGVAERLEQLPEGFGQQALGSSAENLDLRKLEGSPGAWRMRSGKWRVIFFPSGGEFIVASVSQRKDVYGRENRVRLARRGAGLTVIESAPPPIAPEPGSEPARAKRQRRELRVEQNNLSPFSNQMLQQLGGVDEGLLATLRSLPAGIDGPEVIASYVEDPDLAFLLADIWERPQHHLEVFDAGEVPTVESLALEESEIKQRLQAPETGTQLAAAGTSAEIARLLDSSIEDWMIYLQPSQRATANADYKGPSRVRGGPGTGKTVVALHRARVIARDRLGEHERVLLTTFLKTLPPVWDSLMESLDPEANQLIDIQHLDKISTSVVGPARVGQVLSEKERQKLVQPLLAKYSLTGYFGDNPQLLLAEFDAFLTGRGISELDDYLALRRRGGLSPLDAADRRNVFAAYEEYLTRLEKNAALDWGLLRLEALRLVEGGAGPRYNGVIIDEAQDLSAVSMRLLLALDESENHCNFMVVGDGQQSIYPGGFSLRDIGIDIVGRSRVLTTNWRNTWSIWAAARAVIGGQEFDDLDDERGVRPVGDDPLPLAMGDDVELHQLRSLSEENELLVALIAERIEEGVDPGDIAVLVDSNRKVGDVSKELAAAGIPTEPLEAYDGQHSAGVLVGTFNRSKALEFKEVFISRLAAEEWPSRWFVPPGLDEEQHAERMAGELRKLFVGMTRARDRLALLVGGDLGDALEAARWAMDYREY